ncbi:MAG: hypothetical protein K2K07_13050 [Lachnospiraceae bacterium]|nr:hypothetical protein [Lachnospiraceae bacterium]
MIIEGKSANGESILGEDFVVRITNPMLYDRLHTLSAEYSVSTGQLVNIAVKRLFEDIDFVRELRAGRIKLE